MSRKLYHEDEVIRSLSKKSDFLFSEKRMKRIFILNPNSSKAKCDLGNKSQGKIDFLVKYCGYQVVSRTVKSFDKKILHEEYPMDFHKPVEKKKV